MLGVFFSLLLHCCLILFGALLFEYTPPPGANQPVKPLMPPKTIMELKLEKDEPEPMPEGEVFKVLARAHLPHETMPNRKHVILISPKKVDRPPGMPKVSEEVANNIYFGSGIMKQGNEVRISLRSLAGYDFTTKDFFGRYKVAGEDRIVEIHNAAGEHLLFVDVKTGTRRLLKQVGKFIYTYGPSFDVYEPVVGSITFFPHKHGKTSLPSRLLWLPDTPPSKIATMMDWQRELPDED